MDMEGIFFKSNTGETRHVYSTPDGKIDFKVLGSAFGLEPSSISLSGSLFPIDGFLSYATWTQIKNADPKLRTAGTQENPVLVEGRPTAQAPSGGERPPKRSKLSVSESVDKVKKEWKSKYSKFLENSKERRCELSTENGVPLDHRGRPSILLDRLTAGWTKKDVGVLWDRANGVGGDVVPVIGVSGSGKTRFLYELLAEKWGFFWTARTKGNGGSEDVAIITQHRKVDDKAANHSNVMGMMRCAILARLLILEIFLEEISDLEPLQWLMLQVQFRVFTGTEDDVYQEFAAELMRAVLEDSDGVNNMIYDLWRALKSKLKCDFILVLDEAQGLGSIGENCYESPETRELRSIFSPLVKALKSPCTSMQAVRVFVAGTGISFLKLESEIDSALAKESVGGSVQFASAPFSSWRDVDQVLEFCSTYLSLEDAQEDNAYYLLRKFRGRRRCLVSCVERLLQENKGVWSKELVDGYFEEITGSSSSNSKDATSIFYAVERLCKSKGYFVLSGQTYNADALVRRLGIKLAFEAEADFSVITQEDATLLEAGLGQLVHASHNQYTFSICEPTVHWSILNYLRSTISLETLLKQQMISFMNDTSAVGRLWEKLFTIHVAQLFDGKKLLADMCCFKGADLKTLPKNFAINKPVITGAKDGAWREKYDDDNHTVSAFLDAEEKDSQRCLIFDDRSGPDVLFVVRLGDLKIPVFCQLKLRRKVDWGSAEATTNPPSMYSKYDKSGTRVVDVYKDGYKFRNRVVEACKDGYISLVVCYPAKKPAKRESETQNNRLLGYVGRTEAEVLFGHEVCNFLCGVK